MAKSGKGDDACKRGKRGRLSGTAGPRLSGEAAIRIGPGVGAPPDRGARTRARCVSPPRAVAGVVIPTAAWVGLVRRNHRRHVADAPASAARARSGVAAPPRARLTCAPPCSLSGSTRRWRPIRRRSEAEIFRRVLKAHPDERLAQSILIDRNGRVVEFDGAQSRIPFAAGGSLRRPKACLARRVIGVAWCAFRRERGDEQFAAVRALSRASARVAFASPVDLHLAAWRRAALVTVFLLASTVALLAGGGRPLRHRRRRKRRRVLDERARRARVDLALNRGRCGLWTWDLERGRIQWSASMFDLLELAGAAEPLDDRRAASARAPRG